MQEPNVKFELIIDENESFGLSVCSELSIHLKNELRKNCLEMTKIQENTVFISRLPW